MGGVEIQLQPGWKTYWRVPGDSGVPPRFDFSKSANVESVTPLYPGPRTFDDGAGGVSYGYGRDVIFPLRIVPKNPERAGAAARLGPATRSAKSSAFPSRPEAPELSFTSAASALDSLVATALNKVPKPVGTSEATPLAVRILQAGGRPRHCGCRRAEHGQARNVRRGPVAGLGVARAQAGGSAQEKGIVRFEFKLEGLPANAKAEGAALKLTVVGADGAFEYNVQTELSYFSFVK